MSGKRARPRALSTDAILTPDELIDITRKVKFKAQRRALGKMGIKHAIRPDGSLVVSRALVTAMLGRFTETPAPSEVEVGVNLSAFDRGAGRRLKVVN
jgi:hypothetical protein